MKTMIRTTTGIPLEVVETPIQIALEEITNSICRSLVKRLPRWYLEEEVSVLF